MKTAEQYATKAKKIDLTLISANANEAEARVLEVGDSKYARRDYLNQPDYDLEAMRALLRHVAEVLKGNHYDEETGQPHLAHVRANTGIILECWAVHNIEPGMNWPHEPAKPQLWNAPSWEEGVVDDLHAKADASQEMSQGTVAEAFMAVKEGAEKSQAQPCSVPIMVPQGRNCS